MPLPIDPSIAAAAGGPEWSVGAVGPVSPAPPADRTGFGTLLAEQVDALGHRQAQAAEATRALATGQAESPEAAVMAVERARLSMQLASQIRTRAVEGMQEIFRTQV